MHAKKTNVISKISLLSWVQCRYSGIAQRIFKYSDIQYISLTLDKKLNSLIYRTLFYVNICGSYKLSKKSVFGPPCSCGTLYNIQIASQYSGSHTRSPLALMWDHLWHQDLVRGRGKEHKVEMWKVPRLRHWRCWGVRMGTRYPSQLTSGSHGGPGLEPSRKREWFEM